MDNKEELLEAIDHYNILTPKCRIILKALVNLAINNRIVITIKELSELCGASKLASYYAIEQLETEHMIEVKRRPKTRLSEFILKPNNLEEIIRYRRAYLKLKNSMIDDKKNLDL